MYVTLSNDSRDEGSIENTETWFYMYLANSPPQQESAYRGHSYTKVKEYKSVVTNKVDVQSNCTLISEASFDKILIKALVLMKLIKSYFQTKALKFDFVALKTFMHM